LLKAVALVIADVMVSLDNAFALAAVFGLLLSGPTTILSAGLLASLMIRLPILIWIGAAILGWVGGQLIARDPAFRLLQHASPPSETWIGALGGATVFPGATLATMLKKRHRAKLRRS
jgi:predicted tellurium resistance membrane protein TerC